MGQLHENLITPEQARTLDGLLAIRARRSPEGEAYGYFDRDSGRWQSYSWQQIAAEVSRWQAAISEEGLGAGARVALQLRNCPEWVMFDQAALGLGLVTVPLYTDDRPANIAYILEEAGCRMLDAGNAWPK